MLHSLARVPIRLERRFLLAPEHDSLRGSSLAFSDLPEARWPGPTGRELLLHGHLGAGATCPSRAPCALVDM